jgi:hypothetical protein
MAFVNGPRMCATMARAESLLGANQVGFGDASQARPRTASVSPIKTRSG